MNVDVSARRAARSPSTCSATSTPCRSPAARRRASPRGWPTSSQPRFSPDGRRIAFTSDRGGGDNIWLMNVDGSDKRQLTKEDFRLLNQPSWSPDGRFIVAKKHFTTGRSLGTGEVWLYHVSGGGGVPLVKRASEQHQKELGEPIYAPDGKSVYLHPQRHARRRSSNMRRIRTPTCSTSSATTSTPARSTTAVSGAGGSVRPTPSPDGKKIAFVRRERDQSKLYVKDLAIGRGAQDLRRARPGRAGDLGGDRRLSEHGLDAGQPSRSCSGRAARSAASTPTAASARGDPVPRQRHARGRSTRRIRRSRSRPTASRPRCRAGPSVSPDGRQVVFESLGKLWIKPMAGGAPRRLTERRRGELRAVPVLVARRPDASSSSAGPMRASAGSAPSPRGGGAARDVTTPARPLRAARASRPTARRSCSSRRSGGGLTSPRWSDNPGVYRVAGDRRRAGARSREDGAAPQFGAANDRAVHDRARATASASWSAPISTARRKRVHAERRTGQRLSTSRPTAGYVAFRQNYEAFVMPLMPGSQEVAVDTKGGALPVTRVSADGADFIHWSNDGGAAPLEHGADALHAPTPTRSVPRRAGRRGRAEVRAADDRRVAVDGASPPTSRPGRSR